MIAFIKLGADSVSHPHVQAMFQGKKDAQEALMNEDAVYESPSDFYANFIFELLKGMLTEEESKAFVDAGSSLLGIVPEESKKQGDDGADEKSHGFESINLGQDLYDNKDLRHV